MRTPARAFPVAALCCGVYLLAASPEPACARNLFPAALFVDAHSFAPPDNCDEAFLTALARARDDWAGAGLLRVSSTSDETGEEPKKLSPTKAALMSAIVPGLGQFMSGHPKMGAAYLGVEAVGWTGYSILRTDGYEKRHDARIFADAHYDSTVYNRRKDESASDPPNKELPYNDDLEYYEDISKLNEVIWGWDDHVPREDALTHQLRPGSSERREDYKDMRNEGNDELRTSRSIGLLLFVNHITSAIHAYKLVQWYNENVNREFSGLKFKFKQTPDKQGYACVVSKRF